MPDARGSFSAGKFVFLTGDLGFKTLEPLRDAWVHVLSTPGIAEQNMICVAASMAKTALRPWVYSIAPFVYARPFEQIRNDVCLPDLPVVLVGNGGGYGYGVMGSTHHALEDYGALLTLANMRVFIPAFDSDVMALVDLLMEFPLPYLRLGLAELPKGVSNSRLRAVAASDSRRRPHNVGYGPNRGWAPRCRDRSSGRTGTAVDMAVEWCLYCNACLREFWLTCAVPVTSSSWRNMYFRAAWARQSAIAFFLFRSPCDGLPTGSPAAVSGLYGSQKFHRKESQLDTESIRGAARGWRSANRATFAS